MWQIALFAPLIDCSINGEFNALIAASSLLLSPLPVPKPIKAIPLSFKVFLTSAKSRLITAGLKIKSVIVFTDYVKTASASLKAYETGKFTEFISNLSLLTIIKLSTLFFKLFKPSIE